MNQELMTLDFWQDTVIYEGKIFPIGTLACDALNVPADTLARMNEQCEKIKIVGCRGRNPCCPLETEIQDQTKKKIATAIYEYQADCDGEWGQISFDLRTAHQK